MMTYRRRPAHLTSDSYLRCRRHAALPRRIRDYLPGLFYRAQMSGERFEEIVQLLRRLLRAVSTVQTASANAHFRRGGGLVRLAGSSRGRGGAAFQGPEPGGVTRFLRDSAAALINGSNTCFDIEYDTGQHFPSTLLPLWVHIEPVITSSPACRKLVRKRLSPPFTDQTLPRPSLLSAQYHSRLPWWVPLQDARSYPAQCRTSDRTPSPPAAADCAARLIVGQWPFVLSQRRLFPEQKQINLLLCFVLRSKPLSSLIPTNLVQRELGL